jgi:hypothetical protein
VELLDPDGILVHFQVLQEIEDSTVGAMNLTCGVARAVPMITAPLWRLAKCVAQFVVERLGLV